MFIPKFSFFIVFLEEEMGFIPLLEKAKLAREISDEKNQIPHKFLGRKI